MATVKVLVDYVGVYMAGDIVKDAPPGLVHMAKAGTRNAATGELVAEFVEDENQDQGVSGAELLKELKASAKALKIANYGKMNEEELTVAIKEAIANSEKEEAEAIEAQKQVIADAEELKGLLAKAEELKIIDADKLSRDELITAIETAGGGTGGE